MYNLCIWREPHGSLVAQAFRVGGLVIIQLRVVQYRRLGIVSFAEAWGGDTEPVVKKVLQRQPQRARVTRLLTIFASPEKLSPSSPPMLLGAISLAAPAKTEL